MSDPRATALALSLVLASGCAAARSGAPTSVGRQTAHASGGLRYLLHLPAAYETRSDWPMILFLHGGGERGRDLALVRREGLPRILETLPDFPFVVVSPQEEKGRLWTPESLAMLVEEAVSRLRVDSGRVYATGLSSGADAALELAIRHPAKIAAVAAVSPSRIPRDLCAMKEVPVWIFQNAGDERVPPALSRKLARSLEDCNGKGEVELTLYRRDGHDAWTETYRRRDLYEWFLKQRLRAQ